MNRRAFFGVLGAAVVAPGVSPTALTPEQARTLIDVTPLGTAAQSVYVNHVVLGGRVVAECIAKAQRTVIRRRGVGR